MFTQLIPYFQELETKLRAMPARSAFAMALAAIERRWMILERAASEELESKVDLAVFRQAIDRGWLNGRMQVAIPTGFWTTCRRAVPADSGTPASKLGQKIAESIAELIRAMEEGKSNHAYRVCVQNFDLLESLLEHHGKRPDDLRADPAQDSVELHRLRLLVDNELYLQQLALQRLEHGNSPTLLEAVRRGSVGVNLYGAEWFKVDREERRESDE